jgi:hypothetical protein
VEHSSVDEPIERASQVPETEERSARPRSNRILAFSLIAALILGGLLLVTILNAGGYVAPEDAPSGWDDVDAVDEPKPIDLGEGERTATVVIGAGDNLCWSGYISAQKIDGCGPQVFSVTGAGKTMGANIRHTSTTRAFLGLAVWTGDGDTQLERDQTRKPLGVIAITAYPNQPGAI